MGGSKFQKSIDPLGYKVFRGMEGGGGKKKGGGGGGGQQADPNAAFYDYMAKMQKMQLEQQAAAEKAQKEAFQAQQQAAGLQSQQMGELAAKQQLGLAGSMQGIRDANALQAAQQAQSAAAAQATGGGFDLSKSREEALANMGAAGGMVPATMQNLPVTPQMTNPALAQLPTQAAKRANVFSAPSMTDLRFGGV